MPNRTRRLFLVACAALLACATPPGDAGDAGDPGDLGGAVGTPREARAATGTGEPARVVRVHDGDTLTVRTAAGVEERVRIVGIDAPELRPRDRATDPFAREATEALERLTSDGNVVLVTDPRTDDRDKYGRLLRHVESSDGASIGVALVERGLAFAFTRFAFEGRAAHVAAERSARSAGVGVWSSPRSIAPEDAADHVGAVVSIEAVLHDVRPTERGPVFVDVWPERDDPVIGIVFPRDLEAWDLPAAHGQRVRLLGRVTTFRNRPQIQLRSSDQLVER